MHIPTLTFTTLFYLSHAYPHSDLSQQPRSCADVDRSVTVCAEIYNATGCTGEPTIAAGEKCHNVWVNKGGFIHVRRGAVFAGFTRSGCKTSPEVLTGPMWRKEDQGCQSVGKMGIKSWNAF